MWHEWPQGTNLYDWRDKDWEVEVNTKRSRKIRRLTGLERNKITFKGQEMKVLELYKYFVKMKKKKISNIFENVQMNE